MFMSIKYMGLTSLAVCFNLILVVTTSSAEQIRPQEIVDYCEQQGVNILHNKFGHNYSVFFSGRSIDTSYKQQYYSFSIPQLCRGDFYLTLSPGLKTNNCTDAHKGQIPQKFVTLYAFGDCHRLVPNVESVSPYY